MNKFSRLLVLGCLSMLVSQAGFAQNMFRSPGNMSPSNNIANEIIYRRVTERTAERGEDFESIKRAAEQGNALAQFRLGWMYANGRGVARNDAEAVKWLKKSVEQGNAYAQNELGAMYISGRGVAQNDAEAVKWFAKSAEQGYAGAQRNLGWMYANGRGVTQNDAEAMKWYAKAAEQGDAVAQDNLGRMYSSGRGVAQNDAEAVKWYVKSAEQGNAGAQNELGFMYSNGRGVAQNDAEAAKWFVKSAEQGYALAQRNLGWAYANGRGVPKNDAEAVKWYTKAAEQGDKDAQGALGAMKNQPAYVKARHQYKRTTPISESVDKFVEKLSLEQAEKAEVKTWLNSAMDAVEAGAKKLNRQENVSFAAAFLLCSAYEILYAEDFVKDFDDEKFERIAKSLDQASGRRPEMDGATDVEKQEFVDAMIIPSAFLLVVYKSLTESKATQPQSLKAIERVRDDVRQHLQKVGGVDEKKLKSRLEELSRNN